MKTVALRLDQETYNKFSNITKAHGSSMAQELREMIDSFCDEGALRDTAR